MTLTSEPTTEPTSDPVITMPNVADELTDLQYVNALLQRVGDRRWVDDSIAMARAAFAVYDPAEHVLVQHRHDMKRDPGDDREITYRAFFQQVSDALAPGARPTDTLYFRCKNVRTAIEILDLLIEGGAAR